MRGPAQGPTQSVRGAMSYLLDADWVISRDQHFPRIPELKLYLQS